MDHGTSALIYFDTRARSDYTLTDANSENLALETLNSKNQPRPVDAEIDQNVKSFLTAFSAVYVCRSTSSAVQKIESIQSECHGTPLLVAVQACPDRERSEASSRQARSPSPRSAPSPKAAPSASSTDLIGIHFLQHIVSERCVKQIFNYVTLVVVMPSQEQGLSPLQPIIDRGRTTTTPKDRFTSHAHYFQAGAVDVLQGPLNNERVQCLPAHALRTCNEFRAQYPDAGRDSNRGSWAANHHHDTKQPYPYLRESMVSGLMDRICDPDYVEKPVNTKAFHLPPDRETAVAVAVGTWGFSAHDFTDDELTYATFLILKHTLSMPGLEKWRLADEPLLTFILACRRVYNSFVIYHNFRHACDVLQATFYFLLSLGVLPPYPALSHKRHDSRLLPNGIAEESDEDHKKDADILQDPPSKTPLASIIRPFEAMTLIISAVGHDVGHPGVNNLFLVTLNAPLAQLYNDRSVLESFHCAAFSQILRRYWPKAFEDVALRKLMINSILATDMSVHSNYINDLGKLNKDMGEDKSDFVADLASAKLTDTRTLLCCLLIKCADISNVARKFNVATEWAEILTDEFANQAKMESELDMASCLFGGPPVQNDIIKMGASQIGFINIFGIPLFRMVAQALPGMQFAVDELQANRSTWEKTMEDAKRKSAAPGENTAAETPTAERNHSPHHFRRGSTMAQSQMRADPMVFGAHSSLSSPRGNKRHSAGSSQFSGHNLSPSRRASLGPTVIPSGLGTPLSASRRSSAGQAKMLIGASKLAEFQGTPGVTSDASAQARGMDGTNDRASSGHQTKSNSLAVTGEGLSKDSSAQALMANPPHFTLKDPTMARNTSRPGELTAEKRRHSASGEANRGRDKMPVAARVQTTESTGASERSSASRQRRSRKFSLKFWRKSRSLDRSSGRPSP